MSMLGSFFQVIFHGPDCKQNFLKYIIKLKTSVPRGNVHDEKHWEKPATDVSNGHQQTLTALLSVTSQMWTRATRFYY